MSEVVPAAPAAPAAAPAPAAIPDPNATAAPGTEPLKPEEQQPPRTFTQAELDEILEKRLAKERRKREEQKREVDYWRKTALDKSEKPAAQPTPKAGDGEPKRDDFDSYESYIEARAEWRASKAVEDRLSKQAEEDAKKRTAEEQQKLEKVFRERAVKFAKEIEDFDEVMESSEAPMTKEMADAILTSDIGPKIAYHLAQHPEEAERIAAQPASRRAAEIGKLEAKLAEAPPPAPKPKPSGAPDPIDPVGGNKGKVTTDEPSDKDSPDEWLRKRNSQLRKKRG